MKLYDVPRDSYVKILEKDIRVPPVHPKPPKLGDIIYFDHVDGMYSFCRDYNNNIIHLAAWTEVEISSKFAFMHQYD